MFILGLIGIIVVIASVFFMIAMNAKEYENRNRRKNETPLSLSDDFDDSNLTDSQKQIVELLRLNGPTKEKDIIGALQTSNQVIKQLINQGVLIRDNRFNPTGKQIGFFALSIIGFVAAAIFANYYFLVRINYRYFGMVFFTMVFIFMAVNFTFVFLKMDIRRKTMYNRILAFSFGAVFIFLLIFGGRPIFHADEYAELIEISEADFINDIDTVDIDTLPLVDKAYANKLGALKLGEFPGIGSEFETGAYSDIIYQGQQYLVAPLEYRGIFKWLSNRGTGTPGYILINKVTAETQLINLRETTGEGLIYTPSAFFYQDLVRHAYYNGMSRYKLENQFFEIDESGMPYYVLQYSLPTIFINGGPKINKIAVVNALNGETNIYSPGEEPDWVESVYPNGLIFQQLDYWGSLQEGWLNSVFAQRGVLQPSNGTRVIMNNDELYYFTGLTSAGNDESTIGFVYAGMKTKETRLFRFPGATEEAAMNKVLTLLPQNNISTSFPIPINIEDIPTYFILIKGEDGRILRYVYISVQDLEVFSMAETKINAYNNYLVRLSESDTSAMSEVSGLITDLISYVSGGNTIYWVELDNDLRYKINVSNFSDAEMSYFTSLDIGDSINLSVLDYTVMEIEIE